MTGIEAVIAELRGRGVVFEDYDFGDFKTVGGLGRLRSGQGGLVQGQRGQHVRAQRSPLINMAGPLTFDRLQGLLRL